jgi:type IV pilus assembly protein PilC
MTDSSSIPGSFAFKAQTADDKAITGTIDASDIQDASQRLAELQLRVLDVEPSAAPARSKALKTEDFLAFNQQLAYLTQAGLPVEQGLKLMAQDLGTGRLAETVREVAEDLEKGTPLPAAFDKHRSRFPRLYGRLIDAGVRAHDLPGMLLNLGRHVELLSRMRRTLWRTAAYPLMATAALILVLAFLGLTVLPKYVVVFRDFGTRLPGITVALMTFVEWMPWIIGGVIVAVVGGFVLWRVLKLTRFAPWIIDTILLRVPLIGAVMRRNMISRWCDIVRMGVQAGLDLPTAIDLAGDTIGSGRLKSEGDAIARLATTGESVQPAATSSGTSTIDYRSQSFRISRSPRSAGILPVTVATLLELSTNRADLPDVLGTLSGMYQQQAELRLSALPMVLVPILILFIASVVVFIVLGMFAPMISLFQSIMH